MDMNRIFHVFAYDSKDGEVVVGLIEDGIPKAMTIIDHSLYPPENEVEALAFSRAIVEGFGQDYPVSDEAQQMPWV